MVPHTSTEGRIVQYAEFRDHPLGALREEGQLVHGASHRVEMIDLQSGWTAAVVERASAAFTHIEEGQARRVYPRRARRPRRLCARRSERLGLP
jgi:hypothetical protein